MFVIDNGDAIRGIAEVASKLDFIVSGYVGTTATQLADGQISNEEGDLYASGADATVVTSITVVNTDSVARTFTLYLKPSGGSSRAISPVSLDLGIGHSFYTDGQHIVVMDASGQILSTWAVDDTPVDGETDKPVSSNWAYDHGANTTTAHGAVSAATASKIVVRDASARAKFAAPGASGDALIKGARVTTAELPAMTDERMWKGTGTDVEEIEVPGATKELFVPVSAFGHTGTETTYYDYPSIRLDAPAQHLEFAFRCPHDFTSLTHCKIVGICYTTGTMDWTVATDFAAVGETCNNHSDSDTDDGVNMTSDEIEAIDISAAFTGLAADDFVGIRFTLDALDTMARYSVIGLVFKYD